MALLPMLSEDGRDVVLVSSGNLQLEEFDCCKLRAEEDSTHELVRVTMVNCVDVSDLDGWMGERVAWNK